MTRFELMEKSFILENLEQFQGNRTKAAEYMGIGLRTLQRKLQKYGMKDFMLLAPGGHRRPKKGVVNETVGV